jgi:hypothetical protein
MADTPLSSNAPKPEKAGYAFPEKDSKKFFYRVSRQIRPDHPS